MVFLHVLFTTFCSLWMFPHDEFSWIPFIGSKTDKFGSWRAEIMDKYPRFKNPKLKVGACIYTWFGMFTRMETPRYAAWWYISVFLTFCLIHILYLFIFLFRTF